MNEHNHLEKRNKEQERERKRLESALKKIDKETDLNDVESLKMGCERFALFYLFEIFKGQVERLLPRKGEVVMEGVSYSKTKTLIDIIKAYDMLVNSKSGNGNSGNTYIQNNITLNTFNYLDKKIYESLSDTFTLQDALRVGKELGYAERTVKRVLSKNKVLFERIKQGIYRRKPLL